MSTTIERAEQVRNIDRLQAELARERATLPSAVKRFYRFRMVAPANTAIIVYAENRADADRRVIDRLTAEYGDKVQLHGKVDELDPDSAANNCGVGSSLMDCLTPEQAAEFIADWREDQRGKGVGPKRRSQLVRDIEAYEHRQRRNAISNNRRK